MNSLKFTLGAALAGAAVLSGWCGDCRCQGSGYPETIEEGFQPMFGVWGFGGWEGATALYANGADPATGRRGCVRCVPENAAKLEQGKRGDLYTAKDYRNFILRFEFVMPENGNNGVGIRMVPEKDAAYYGMCELQLLDDGGSSYYDKAAKKDLLKPYQYTGSVYGVVPAKRDNEGKQLGGRDGNFTGGGSYVRRPGFWNFEEIVVAGEEIEVYLNGYLVTKADLTKFKGDGDTPDGRPHPGLHNEKGRIGFLGHGSAVKWRNVRIKELPDTITMAEVKNCRLQTRKAPEGFETFFDGEEEQLKTKWKGVTTEENFDNPLVRQAASAEKCAEMQKKADLQRDAHWSVRNRCLYFDGFKGGYSLATYKDFGDFELWADWRIMSVTGDSGLYLRGTPQVQIWDAHNEWDIGSGGLFNNQKNPSDATAIADRRVGDWNRFHVIMRGKKVTVWLNGVKVVDEVTLENFWDRSKPIFPIEQLELQCHGDPTEWRNIFIREL